MFFVCHFSIIRMLSIFRWILNFCRTLIPIVNGASLKLITFSKHSSNMSSNYEISIIFFHIDGHQYLFCCCCVRSHFVFSNIASIDFIFDKLLWSSLLLLNGVHVRMWIAEMCLHNVHYAIEVRTRSKANLNITITMLTFIKTGQFGLNRTDIHQTWQISVYCILTSLCTVPHPHPHILNSIISIQSLSST